jgi:hypothetical protein
MRLIRYVHCHFRTCFKVVRMVELISPYLFDFLKLFSVLFTDWVNNPISSTFFKVTFFRFDVSIYFLSILNCTCKIWWKANVLQCLNLILFNLGL